MKLIIISIIISVALIGGAIVVPKNNTQIKNEEPLAEIQIVDGKQIIEIKAKGGYQPRVATAQAGIPTILRFKTNATFDCSSSVRISSMDISQNLPPTGTTDIDIGIQPISIFQGSCGMGMYPFEIDFK
jgi:plastocyanin domain-containing protein